MESALAGWVAELEVEDLPDEVRDRVEDLFLDALASAFAGRTQDLLDQVDGPAREFGGAGRYTVIGGEPAGAAAAVLLNAYAITAATICDVYRPGLCHVTPVALPPLLVLAEEQGTTRGDLLAAFAAACEVTVRLARGIDYPAMRERGWHSPGVVGPVGAAAGVARLLRLDAGGTASALAHAAAQGAGTFAALGTEAVKFNQARGSASGFLAGLMGAAGLAAAERWFTHTDGGMGRAYSNGGDPDSVIEGLGSEWELRQISLRRWPAASSVQSLIGAVLQLRAEASLTWDLVARIEVELGPDAFQVSGPRLWETPLAAQQSARWVAATVLADGDWWLEQCSRERITDSGLGARAADQVSVREVPFLRQSGVRVTVTLTTGAELVAARDDAPGDPPCPLTHEQIESKLRRSAPNGDLCDELLEFVRRGEEGTAAAPMVELLGRAA